MQELISVDVRSHPINLGANDASKIATHRNLKDDYAVTIIDSANAHKLRDDLRGR